MKRINLLAIASGLLCVVLAGCGSSSSGGKTDHLVLALRSGTYAEVVKECLPGFEEKYGVTCEVEEYSEDDLHNTILNNSVNKNGSYDIYMADSSWTAELMSDQALASLSDLGYAFDDDIIPATTAICSRDNEIFLVPYYGNVTILLYNKDLLREAGYTEDSLKSLDDVMDLCKKSVSGYIYRGDTKNNIVVDFLPILCAHGGWVVDENNKPTVDTPEFRAALEFYLELIGTGKALPKEDMIGAIGSGGGAAGVGWPGWYNMDEQAKTYFCPVPDCVKDDGSHHNSNIYGIWTMGIPENSGNKKMAMELLKYLMDPEIQKKSVDFGGVPCRYSSLTDEAVLKEYPYYKQICAALESGVYRPDMETWPQFYEILGEQLEAVINGELTVEEGLQIAQEGLEAIP